MKEYYIEADRLPEDDPRPPTPKPIKEEECELCEEHRIVERLDERIEFYEKAIDDKTVTIRQIEHFHLLVKIRDGR